MWLLQKISSRGHLPLRELQVMAVIRARHQSILNCSGGLFRALFLVILLCCDCSDDLNSDSNLPWITCADLQSSPSVPPATHPALENGHPVMCSNDQGMDYFCPLLRLITVATKDSEYRPW